MYMDISAKRDQQHCRYIMCYRSKMADKIMQLNFCNNVLLRIFTKLNLRCFSFQSAWLEMQETYVLLLLLLAYVSFWYFFGSLSGVCFGFLGTCILHPPVICFVAILFYVLFYVSAYSGIFRQLLERESVCVEWSQSRGLY